MTDEVEVSPSTEQGTEGATQSEVPKDFREYATWRATGELPETKEEPATSAAAALETEPPAKTEPDSETDKTTQETGEAEDDESDVAKSRGGSRQRKIDRLTRENSELQQRLLQLQQKQPAAEEPGQKPKAPAPVEAKGKPKLENFETLEAYQEALTDWKLDERESARKAEEQKRAIEEAERKLQTEWSKRQKAAAKAHDDYDDVIDSVKAPEGPGVMAARQAMLEDEAGAEILYYLAKHPDELKRIAALSPVSAVREIGRLSAKLTTPPAPENGKPKITGAPKPPPPSARPSKTSSDSIDDPEVQRDFKRYAAARTAQRR